MKHIELERDGDERASLCRETTRRHFRYGGHASHGRCRAPGCIFCSFLTTPSYIFLTPDTRHLKPKIIPDCKLLVRQNSEDDTQNGPKN